LTSIRETVSASAALTISEARYTPYATSAPASDAAATVRHDGGHDCLRAG
jgi:hypothetical protein